MKHIANYKPKDFAELLNVSVKTLQRWDRDGILIAKRTPTDRRYYTDDQCLEFKGVKNSTNRKIVIYTKVSTNNQKDDLLNQVKFYQDFANAKAMIVIAHEDRFVRFGYEWFEKFLLKFDTKPLVVNNELLSPREELIQDIISILHVFSCRIYGLRKYKKKLEEGEEVAKSIQSGIKANRATEAEN